MQLSTRIAEFDINRPARRSTVLRWSDVILIVGAGLGALAMAVQSVAGRR